MQAGDAVGRVAGGRLVDQRREALAFHLLAELAGGLDDGFDAFGPALPRLQRQVERGQQVVQAGRSEIAGEEPASAAATGEAMPLQGVQHGGELVEIGRQTARSEEHTSELQSLMRISYAVFCLKKKKNE